MFRISLFLYGTTIPDDTLAILDEYSLRFQGRVRLIDNGGRGTGTSRGNFNLIMQQSTADYVLLADHDDVWYPNKVRLTVELLQRTEALLGSETPTFVFTDAEVVDSDLQRISPSFWQYKKIDPEISRDLATSLICPSALGCAAGMNRALVTLAAPIPVDTVTGHDWWAHLVAICFGTVAFSPERTMAYRLHGKNSSRQKEVSFKNYSQNRKRVRKVRRGMTLRRMQAQSLLEVFGNRLSAEARDVIREFVAIGDQSFLHRRFSLLKGGYLYPDLTRNLGMLLGA